MGWRLAIEKILKARKCQGILEVVWYAYIVPGILTAWIVDTLVSVNNTGNRNT